MSKPRIGVLASAGQHFARLLFERFAESHHVEFTGPYTDLSRFDLVWCDWADQAAVVASRRLPAEVPLVVRFQSYELFIDSPAQVEWGTVDRLVFVADHVRRRAVARFGLDGVETTVIPNGVDVDRFLTEPTRRPCRRFAWVGELSPKKGVMLLAEAAAAIRRHLPDATFHLVGERPRSRLVDYLEHRARDPLLVEAFDFHDRLPYAEMPAFYRACDAVLSTSPWEAFQYAVAEGALAGLLPLVHAWPGAETVYPVGALLWRDVAALERLAGQVLAPDQADQRLAITLAAQADIVERYALHRQVEATRALLDRFLGPQRATLGEAADAPGDAPDKATSPPDLDGFAPLAEIGPAVEPGAERPPMSAAMIIKDEARGLARCLESIRGIVDEIVVVDTGSTDGSQAIAESFGARVIQDAWQADFAHHRNQSLDAATHPWLLVIDGDEYLREPGNLVETMAAHAHRAEVDSFALRVESVRDAGGGHALTAERFDAIRVLRKGAVRYKYPIHNQLDGVRHTVATTALIEASYRGTLASKAERSIPMLMRLEAEGSDAERLHARFFLAKTWFALGDHALANRWARAVCEVAPAVPAYALAWLWWFESSLVLEGPDVAESVLRVALEHHPTFPELRRYEASWALVRWHESACAPSRYRGTSTAGDIYLPNLPEAARLLGLPFAFQPIEKASEWCRGSVTP